MDTLGTYLHHRPNRHILILSNNQISSRPAISSRSTLPSLRLHSIRAIIRTPSVSSIVETTIEEIIREVLDITLTIGETTIIIEVAIILVEVSITSVATTTTIVVAVSVEITIDIIKEAVVIYSLSMRLHQPTHL